MPIKISVPAFAIGLFVMGVAVWAAVPAAKQESAAPVTFHKDVLSILQQKCQTCHRPGQIAPMSLLSYKDVRPWAKAIKNAVVTKQMPPWPPNPQYGHFFNDRALKQTEIDTIVAWADSGGPEGDPKDSPAPVQWPAGGWSIQPEVVVDLPVYEVPAKGVKEWENIAIPVPFKGDTWVTSVEVLPGEPAVVHHLCFDFAKHQPTTVYNRYEWIEVPRDEAGVAVRTGPASQAEAIVATREVGSTEVKLSKGRLSIRGGNTFCYLPGLTYDDYRPLNAGFFVPAGSDMIINIHYTTNGKSVIDRSRIGFTVANVPPPKKFVPQFGGEGASAIDAAIAAAEGGTIKLAIPPNETNFMAPPIDITFHRDIELIWFRPHAHVRGKSVRYTLIYPDGREEVVLDVPRYDFNWQLAYYTAMKIPKGAKMHVQWAYDNSPNNKYNPDPNRWVYYGDQSWEEMGTPNMGFLMDRDADIGSFLTRRGFN